MNQYAFQALECDWVLNEVAHYALTSKGKETIISLEPSLHTKQIDRWLEEVSEAVQILDISSSVPIHSLDDVTGMLEYGKKGMFIRPDQFKKLVSFLDHCSKLKRFMKDKGYIAPTIATYADSIEDLSDLEADIQSCIRHGQVDDYASKELAKLRKQIHAQLTKLKDKIHHLAKSKKLSTYLQETVVAEKNGRFVVPIKSSYRTKVKGTVIDSSASGATVFIEPEEITTMQEELEMLRLAEEREVEQVLYYLTALVLEREHELSVAVETMHQYDVIFAKAHYSKQLNAAPATINEDYTIDLKEARHPLLGDQAVPLTVYLGSDQYALVITGPNTGGKTVTLKTIGLLTFMTQVGLHIPAEKGSSLHLFHDIFVDIGDGQSITENLSTFSSRLVNIIHILQEANDHSLVLLDELGSGTDPTEGMGLATAILDQLYQKGSTIFATTHYNEMKDFAEEKEGFLNGSMEFDLETLRPTYRLLLDTTGKSQAFQIALKLGMHPAIIEKAHSISYKEDASYSSADTDTKQSDLAKQVAVNRYARQSSTKEKAKLEDRIPHYDMGDNVTVLATGETGIVYKGPDKKGNYIVQIKGEKQTLNHKRIQLHIPARDLYPDDYDFDIIFKSKEYRKVRKQLDRKHVEGVTLEEED
ncbi:endonuclease MutS2 [Pontibacillus yanchengensis]|uniref:Endonuclease MutS2 n=1 Tax=Pontibacillus yanchengensis TaxID=462910 RepID=A0A6I4ZZV4_9BACI|nr:endonuclease MutS2 [Pontibacillus yanchengensis]MYL33630.1 endonuclease MutS2 [Pontibacillus yanchengensis]